MKKSSLTKHILDSREQELHSALSILFKPKQIVIIKRILENKELTKTEYEYFIRVIKKKLIATTQLQDISSITLRKKVKK